MDECRNIEQSDGMPVISAYIITKNEEKNIGRALESVRWIDELIVLDSGSTDDTVEIAKNLGAKVTIEAFKGFVKQKSRAMELCAGKWLFNLDADEEVTPELRKSIESVLSGERDKFLKRTLKSMSSDMPVLFNVCRKTCYLGRWMKHCGWYPEFRARLSRREHARWEGEELHEQLEKFDKLEGDSKKGFLKGDLLHRPYDDLGAHLKAIDCYTEMFAKREASHGRKAGFIDILIRPFAAFFKMYILKAGFMDYGPGLIASMMGAWYTFMKYARLYEFDRNFQFKKN